MNRNVYVSARVVLQKFTPGNIIEGIYIGKQISYKSVIFGKCSRFSFYKKRRCFLVISRMYKNSILPEKFGSCM